MKKNGLSLIEILVAISILLIIFAMTIISFRSFQQEQLLFSSTEEIINILRFAQSKTLASGEGAASQGSKYGVYFDISTDPHQYTLFRGTDYASRPDPSSDEVNKISKLVEINLLDLLGLSGKEVVFDRLTGETANSGKISLRLKSDHSKTKTVGIKSSGKITLGEETFGPDDSGRIKDSRHVHFNLGWSIQNATALEFYFPDTGDTELVNDISSYFDAGKTEFNWEGAFSIGLVDQVFKIHTHFLDASNTILCIHRDRNDGKNNQKVIITIVDLLDKDIAHYLADVNDTVDLGAFGGTKEVQ